MFTNTDFTTEAGRQSLISKSVLSISNWILRKCAVASKASSIYACIFTDYGAQGAIAYITLDPTSTTVPVFTRFYVNSGSTWISCEGDYCYANHTGSPLVLRRFTSTPNSSGVTIKCDGDTQSSFFSKIDVTNDYTMHGQSSLVLMRRAVNDATYALVSNVLKTHTIQNLTAGHLIYVAEFLTFTGFTDKAILAIGTTTKNESLKIMDLTNSAILESFDKIDTGTQSTFSTYNGQYFNNFDEVSQTTLILVSFHFSYSQTNISVINYLAKTSASIVNTNQYRGGV